MPSEDEHDHQTEISAPSLAKKRAPQTYIGRVIADRYRIVGPIGRGGAGNVYRGLQEPLNREVAVKILRPDLSEESKVEWQARFLREAALAGRLSHPNVITVHDYGVMEDGASFVVMEFVRGKTLSELIPKGKALQPARAANLTCQIARGLRAVHDAELIHRDVKPQNIVVVEEDGRERAVLLDFGLVKVAEMSDSDMDSYQTRAGTYMGTPAYMAPEQAKGGRMDHRVDLYALGCMLFRLLTGSVPFTAEHPLGMAVQHMTEPVPAFRDIAPDKDIPARLEKVVRRLMEKEPDRRYRTSGDVVAELEKFLEDPPLPKAPPAPVRGAVGAGVGAVGAGLGLVGVALAAIAIFVALVVVMLFAQSRDEFEVEPAVPVLPVQVVPAEPSEVPKPEAAPREAPAPSPQPAEPTDPRPHVLQPSAEPLQPNPAPVRAPRPDPKPAPAPDPAPSLGLPMPGVPMPGVPSPSPVPAPSPAPVPVPASVVPGPSPAQPAPAAPGDVLVDEVRFSKAGVAKALGFVNTATPEELAAAGIYRKGVEVIVAKRPFASLQAFGGTYGIGKKTMQSVRDAAR